ncbi:MAG: MASE3 domain-containing protein, partial [Candidatus Eisenbacteria bacterium]|nr:MASE3 domain-containing protein [Candidatus Eisenbacteria bacterium]
MAPTIVAIAGIVAVCWFLASARYLLFHSVAELLGIVVAAVIFVIAWNSWRFARNGYLLFLGIASAPIASLDLIHTLAYRGMGVFPGADANLPTQLWIGSRALQALALLLAPLFLGRRPRPWRFAAGGWAVTALVAASIFAGIFPDCYVDGSGLTLFKRMSEYVIVLLMLASIPLLLRRREEFDPRVLRLLVLSIALMAVTDVTFTLYVSVTDLFNRLGHLLKIASVLFLYAAIVETSFRKPYHLLLRNLKTSEDALALAVEQEEAARQAAEDAAGRLRALNEDLRAVNERLAAQSRELRALALDNARLYNDAREANAAKDQLLAVVSHELRNPLSPIVTGVEILSHTLPSDSPAHTTLDIIRRNARLQARLVDDLLDLSRISRGGLPLQQAPVALDEVVEAASRDQRAAAEEAGIDLRVRAAQGGLYVLGDADRLRQVVVNLLTNAIKFTPAGGTIEVRVETDPDTVGTDDGSTPTGATGARKPEGRRFARVVVTDTGAGIGADLLPRIFELFQQGEVAGQRRPGLGLGLSLVKSLVEKHGGRAHAASEGPGKGSRFTV